MLFSSFSVEEGASQANKSELKQTNSPDFSLFRETFSSISCYCSTENAFVVTSVSRARTFLLSRSKGHHSGGSAIWEFVQPTFRFFEIFCLWGCENEQKFVLLYDEPSPKSHYHMQRAAPDGY